MRITSKGQVTIPAEIRKRAGLLPHTEVEFQFDGKSAAGEVAALAWSPIYEAAAMLQ
jgi:AbrB family looped-hinge helix DNA binding protein